MEKLKLAPLGMLCAYFVKVIVSGLNSNDVYIFASLSVLSAIYETVNTKFEKNKLVNKIDELEKKVSSEFVKQKIDTDKQQIDLENLKTQIASVKMSAGFRQVK